ncbi:MAG: hypothetical protein RL591_1087, partial [Planctomycetota bacterium]
NHVESGREPMWRVKAANDGGAIFIRMAERIERIDAHGTLAKSVADPNAVDLALDATRTRLFTNNTNGFIERDSQTLEPLRTVAANPPLSSFPRAIAVLPNATTVFLGDISGRLTALDSTTGAQRWSWNTDSPPAEIRGVCVSRDGTRIAAVGGPHVAVFDAATGTLLWHLNTTGNQFRSPCFSHDGRELLAANYAENVDRFDASNGQLLGGATGVFSQVWATAADPSGRGFAAGGLSARVEIFPREASSEPPCIVVDGSSVRSIAFDSQNSTGPLFASTANGKLFAIDRTTFTSRALETQEDIEDIRAIRVNGLGELVVAYQGGVAWLGQDGAVHATVQLDESAREITVVDDSRAIVICDGNDVGRVAMLVQRPHNPSTDLEGVQQDSVVWQLPQRGQKCGCASPTAFKNTFYVPSGYGQTALVLRLPSENSSDVAARAKGVVVEPLSDQPEHPICAALSPDHKTLAIGCAMNSGELVLADPVTFKVRALLANHRGGVRALAWSPDGTRIASAAVDDTLRIWDVEYIREVLVAWRGEINDLAWHNDGTLWVACSDGKVRGFCIRSP